MCQNSDIFPREQKTGSNPGSIPFLSQVNRCQDYGESRMTFLQIQPPKRLPPFIQTFLGVLITFVILPSVFCVISVAAVPVPVLIPGNNNNNGNLSAPSPVTVLLSSSTFSSHLPVHGVKSEGDETDPDDDDAGMKVGVGCVCDGDCERLEQSDCPWGLTLDLCGCCFMCSRGEGEICGGANGNCRKSLHCQINGSGHGLCSKIDSEPLCNEPTERYGCFFDGESCTCETHWICPELQVQDLFLFDSLESCQSRLAILNSSPGSAVARKNDCRCPEVEDCPLDSYRLPTPENIQKTEKKLVVDLEQENLKSKDCSPCDPAQECMCNPGILCQVPQCPIHWTPSLVMNATGLPGNCCPLWACTAV